MLKKILSALLAAVLALTVCHMTAFAATDYSVTDGEPVAVSVPKAGRVSVAFTPEKTGLYRVASDAEGFDPELSVYVDIDEYYTAPDMDEDNYNFDFIFYFEKDTEYKFYITEFEEKAFSFNLSVDYEAGVDSVEFLPVDEVYTYYDGTEVYPDFAAGDTVTVTLDDGGQIIYVFDENYGAFFDETNEAMPEDLFGVAPILEPVLDEETEEFLGAVRFCFLDYEAFYDVVTLESPVASISYKLAEPIVVVENVSGMPFEDEDGNEVFFYFFDINAGDTLTVKYKDGTTDVFTLQVEGDAEDEEGVTAAFVNAEGEEPDYRYLTMDDMFCQIEQPWKLGTNYFTIGYYGADCKIPVQVIKPGWFRNAGKWYYYDNEEGVKQTGWQKIGGKWYLFAYAEGRMLTGWQKSGGKWYYFNTSGAMQTGWQKIGGKWYYFNASGAMQTGWQKIGGKWYYFNASGAMLTGWQKIGSKWYYFNSGGDMKTGWLKSGGKWYYFESSGAMVAGKSLKIGGKTYKFNASGVCTNP